MRDGGCKDEKKHRELKDEKEKEKKKKGKEYYYGGLLEVKRDLTGNTRDAQVKHGYNQRE